MLFITDISSHELINLLLAVLFLWGDRALLSADVGAVPAILIGRGLRAAALRGLMATPPAVEEEVWLRALVGLEPDGVVPTLLPPLLSCKRGTKARLAGRKRSN